MVSASSVGLEMVSGGQRHVVPGLVPSLPSSRSQLGSGCSDPDLTRSAEQMASLVPGPHCQACERWTIALGMGWHSTWARDEGERETRLNAPLGRDDFTP